MNITWGLFTIAFLGTVCADDHKRPDLDDPKWAFNPKVKVSEYSHRRIEEAAKHFEYRDTIDDLIAQVSEEHIRAYARYITGVTSNHLTRHAQSGAPYQSAVEYVQGVFTSLGLNCRQEGFEQPDYGPNLICELPGTNPGSGGQTVIMSAHLDDRIQNISDSVSDAPGANDNGSGVAALIEIARVVQRVGARFQSNVRFCIWGGEEQGLLGSRFYAAVMRDRNENITAVLNADMIAYKDPEQEVPRLDFARQFADPMLTVFAPIYIRQYIPADRLFVGDGHDGCCSDHQSFTENGYAAISFTEGFGYTLDPAYHTPEDIVDRPDFSVEQIARIAEGMIVVLGVQAAVL